jgi:hypothetical protein
MMDVVEVAVSARDAGTRHYQTLIVTMASVPWFVALAAQPSVAGMIIVVVYALIPAQKVLTVIRVGAYARRIRCPASMTWIAKEEGAASTTNVRG